MKILRIFALLTIVTILAMTAHLSDWRPFILLKPNIGLNLWTSEARTPSDDLFLVSPSSANDEQAFGPQKVFLSDLRGEIKKTWTVPRAPNHSRLREDGVLLSLLLAVGGPKLTSNGGEANELISLDRDGRELGSIKLEGLSHDFVPLGLDKIAVLKFERLSAKEVKLFYPKSEMEFAFADRISLIDYEGREQWGWSLKDHIGSMKTGRLNEKNVTVATGNSIQYVEKNPLTNVPAFLLSFRNLDAVILVEYPSGKILWQAPTEQLSRQHDATLAGDRVLIFNNNVHGNSEIPSMQVIEWDIRTNARTFFWRPPNWDPVTTLVMGGVRRLSNGSILVSNSVSGNLFEVEPIGSRVVWSHLVMPQLTGTRIWTLGASFFRAEVYSANEIAKMKLIE